MNMVLSPRCQITFFVTSVEVAAAKFGTTVHLAVIMMNVRAVSKEANQSRVIGRNLYLLAVVFITAAFRAGTPNLLSLKSSPTHLYKHVFDYQGCVVC